MNFCYRRGLLKVVPLLVALGIAGAGCKDVATTASVASQATGGAGVAALPTSAGTPPAAVATTHQPKRANACSATLPI